MEVASVTKKLNIGERGVYIAALKDGSIGAVPEYTGSILSYLDSKASAKTPDDVFAALQTAVAGQGFAVTKYAAAQDSDTITVPANGSKKPPVWLWPNPTFGDVTSRLGVR